MEGKTKLANNNTNKNKKRARNQKIKFNQAHCNLFNIIFFEIFLILLLKISICTKEYYIEIKVNKKGNIQILSDEYIGTLPSRVYINGNSISMNNKKINVESEDNIIRLNWAKTISNYSYMFSNLSTITSIHMNYMFGQNNDMSYMFYNCYNLEKFTYDINYDQAHGIINMRSMFYNCTSLISFDFNNLYMDYYYDYDKYDDDLEEYEKYYKYISMAYMFYNCRNLKSINVGTKKYKYITDIRRIFYNCFSLTSLNLQGFEINSDSSIDLSYMLYNCSKLEIFKNFKYDLTIGGIKYMFYNCNLLKQISLSIFKSSISISMSGLFYNCYNLNKIEGFNKLYISDTDQMFYNCTSLTNLYFKPKQIRQDINMIKMFYNCIKLNTIIFEYNYFYPNNLNSIFYNCISLKSLELNSFKTNYAKDMSYMFFNCKNLKSSFLKGISFSNQLLINMKGMFQNCESLISLDLFYFYTPNVKIMWDSFKGCNTFFEYIQF